MTHQMNCYEILQVSENAPPEVIKAAYKSLMQRYHPDKDPGNSENAAYAIMLGQAYKVLSDPNLKAAYDINLKQESVDRLIASRYEDVDARISSVSYGLLTAKEGRSYRYIWLLIALIIGLCLYEMVLLKNTHANDVLNMSSEMRREKSDERIQSSKTIPVYLSDLKVTLNEQDSFVDGATHVLTIPLLGIQIGAFDADKILHDVNNNKILIRQKLEERLEDAKYDALINIDGEKYLKSIVLDSLGDTTGANRYKADKLNSEEAEQYGIVEVLLPRSFSVH